MEMGTEQTPGRRDEQGEGRSGWGRAESSERSWDRDQLGRLGMNAGERSRDGGAEGDGLGARSGEFQGAGAVAGDPGRRELHYRGIPSWERGMEEEETMQGGRERSLRAAPAN